MTQIAPSRAPVFVDGVTGTHGVKTRVVFKAVASAQRRRLRRYLGVSPEEMAGTTLPLSMDTWARAQAKIELFDRYMTERGVLNEGQPWPFMRDYWAAISAVQRATKQIADELARLGRRNAKGALRDFIDGFAEEIEAEAD